jgi:hypothetical protein
MFTSARGCAKPMLPMCQLKVKVTIEGQISNTIKYYTICCVRSVSPTVLERFSSILTQMFTLTRWCAEPILRRCQLKVKVTIECQISNNQILDSMSCPLCTLIEGFSSNLAQMFTSTGGCAEPMLLMCQLKVKVTIEGQISNNQILHNMLCSLCKSYSTWKIFFKLGSNVHLNKAMCRTHVAHVSA